MSLSHKVKVIVRGCGIDSHRQVKEDHAGRRPRRRVEGRRERKRKRSAVSLDGSICSVAGWTGLLSRVELSSW